jgi:hypothetical protein
MGWRLAPPLLLLFLLMAQLFLIVRMILLMRLVPQNQREVLAVAVAVAVAVKMVLVIMTPMITMMMAVFLPQLTFLRELRELQLHPTLMWVLVGRVVRGNLARD